MRWFNSDDPSQEWLGPPISMTCEHDLHQTCEHLGSGHWRILLSWYSSRSTNAEPLHLGWVSVMDDEHKCLSLSAVEEDREYRDLQF